MILLGIASAPLSEDEDEDESARPPDKCPQRRSVSGGAGTAGATAGRTPTQNVLAGRGDQADSIHTA